MLLFPIYTWRNHSSESLRYCLMSSIQKRNWDSNSESQRTACLLFTCSLLFWRWECFLSSSSAPWSGLLRLGVLLAESRGSRSWPSGLVTSEGCVLSPPSHSPKLSSCSYCLGKGSLVFITPIFVLHPPLSLFHSSSLFLFSFSLLPSLPTRFLPFPLFPFLL